MSLGLSVWSLEDEKLTRPSHNQLPVLLFNFLLWGVVLSSVSSGFTECVREPW